MAEILLVLVLTLVMISPMIYDIVCPPKFDDSDLRDDDERIA